MNIVIYSNCAGNVIKTMFENHSYTRNKCNVLFFSNYENLHKNNIDDSSMMAFILYPTVKLSSNMTYDSDNELYKFEINHNDYPHYDKIKLRLMKFL